MKNILLILIYVCLIIVAANSQDCGVDVLHERKMLNDAAYKAQISKLNTEVYQLLKFNKQKIRQQQIVVPLVVHILHLGEAEGTGSNISDSKVFDAVRGLNDRFSNAIGAGVDLEFEFRLATRDPNGCPTTGINRVDASSIPGYAEFGIGSYCDSAASATDMKDLSRWPVSDYYNIWVVHRIPRDNCSQVWGGYAYYPYGGVYDGAVMRAQSMNYSATTLTHELGHGFNLRHTFHGDLANSTCPVDNDCLLEGDLVCDTPPHKQSDCGATNPCTASGIWDNSRYNYMSYCNPSQSNSRFTLDQKDRIIATFQVYPRNSLLNSLGCTAPDLAIQLDKTDMTCDSICDGKITANNACSLEYSYLWSNQDTTQTISGLCAGTYTVTVTSAGGFVDSATISIAATPMQNVIFEIPEALKTLCVNTNEAYLLTTGSPSGGTYIGDGLSANMFYPKVAGLGKHVISYKYPNEEACAVIVSDTITVEGCVGVEEISFLNEVQILPNPFSEKLLLSFNSEKETKVQIRMQDISGKQVWTENRKLEISRNTIELNLGSQLADGMYFITISNANKAITYKVLKAK